MAMPVAAVTACCSAMPTSIKRSGKRSPNGSRPVEPGMAAVMATTSGRVSASLMMASEKAPVYEGGPPVAWVGPVSGSNTEVSWRRCSSSCSAGG